MFYFVDILSGARNIFYGVVFKFFFLLNVRLRDISEPHKNPVKRGESSYK